MVAKFAPFIESLFGKRQQSAADTAGSVRDTLVDEEESGIKPRNNLVEQHLRQFQGSAVEIIEFAEAKLIFRQQLYRLIKKNYLRPIYKSLSALDSEDETDAIIIKNQKDLADYLKLLDVPKYKPYCGDTIILRIHSLISMADWNSIEGINEIKNQLLEILEIPTTVSK